MQCAINFYRDFRRKHEAGLCRRPMASASNCVVLGAFLSGHPEAEAEAIEKAIYDIGRANYDKPGKIFPLLYRVLLGQERGPRLGAFIRLATPAKIAEAMNGALGSTGPARHRPHRGRIMKCRNLKFRTLMLQRRHWLAAAVQRARLCCARRSASAAGRPGNGIDHRSRRATQNQLPARTLSGAGSSHHFSATRGARRPDNPRSFCRRQSAKGISHA